ncbi:OLC1v1030805C1 [Oldenlandia corymbosa var. corymbosa]|uniref:OLC1v1030805C1 n=1 Tax=Oldenlandia corymbosa var. corymbosa TaxID=529605 RepID=A0AAV1CK77_OLDCO|nr:OLC1v1030805C1 [Oldenlandia corymbosa var. corymbosa]
MSAETGDKKASSSGLTTKEKESVLINVDGANSSKELPAVRIDKGTPNPNKELLIAADALTREQDEQKNEEKDQANMTQMLETLESVAQEDQLAVSSQRAVSDASANLSNDGTTIILQESSYGNHVTCAKADDKEDEAEEIFSDFAPASVMNTSQGREKLFLTEEGIIDLNSSELEASTK